MRTATATVLALTVALAACLEIEETVEVRAEGDAEDLDSGFPLPTRR